MILWFMNLRNLGLESRLIVLYYSNIILCRAEIVVEWNNNGRNLLHINVHMYFLVVFSSSRHRKRERFVERTCYEYRRVGCTYVQKPCYITVVWDWGRRQAAGSPLCYSYSTISQVALNQILVSHKKLWKNLKLSMKST